MAYHLDPPRPGNGFMEDALLREYLSRVLPAPALASVQEELSALGALSGGRLHDQQLAGRLEEPALVQWDPWGRRVDRIALTSLWREAAELAARHGLVALAYERPLGAVSRIHQMALVHVLEPSLDVYSCPLAMTDGAARTLLDLGTPELVERAIPRLTSRDPDRMWTSGQWMTERAGGSDVSGTETVARLEDGTWRLHGTKWFTSATTAEMALTLARPEGNPPGRPGAGALLPGDAGRRRHLQCDPGEPAQGQARHPEAPHRRALAGGRSGRAGPRALGRRPQASPPCSTSPGPGTRWSRPAGMRRGPGAGARLRRAGGWRSGPRCARSRCTATRWPRSRPSARPPSCSPSARWSCSGEAEERAASEAGRALLRVVTPLAKLTTGKQAVAVATEVLECFGGAGYVEDTGIPRLLRDAQVLPIWEGTTNVLSLEALRALGADQGQGARALREEIVRRLRPAGHPELREPAAAASAALAHAEAWLEVDAGAAREAGARRLALTLGRTLALALLVDHAHAMLETDRGRRAAAAARRFARNGVDWLGTDPASPDEDQLLADGAAG